MMINLIQLISVLVFIEVKRASSTQECLFGTYSIYNKTNTPGSFAGVSFSAELGLQFYSDVDGYVLGVRFYKGSTQAGFFSGSLWTSAGTLISTAVFGAVTTTGWQTVNFSRAIKITATTPYVVSYHTSLCCFIPYDDVSTVKIAQILDNPPLHAINGTYAFKPFVAFPTISSETTHYWVDVIFKANCTSSSTPSKPSKTKPTPTAIPTVFTPPSRANFYFYNGHYYSTLTDVLVNSPTSSTCQRSYYLMPPNWILAPFNRDSLAVITSNTWSTTTVVVEYGKGYYSKSSSFSAGLANTKYTDWILTSYNLTAYTYTCISCNCQILIRYTPDNYIASSLKPSYTSSPSPSKLSPSASPSNLAYYPSPSILATSAISSSSSSSSSGNFIMIFLVSFFGGSFLIIGCVAFFFYRKNGFLDMMREKQIRVQPASQQEDEAVPVHDHDQPASINTTDKNIGMVVQPQPMEYGNGWQQQQPQQQPYIIQTQPGYTQLQHQQQQQQQPANHQHPPDQSHVYSYLQPQAQPQEYGRYGQQLQPQPLVYYGQPQIQPQPPVVVYEYYGQPQTNTQTQTQTPQAFGYVQPQLQVQQQAYHLNNSQLRPQQAQQQQPQTYDPSIVYPAVAAPMCNDQVYGFGNAHQPPYIEGPKT